MLDPARQPQTLEELLERHWEQGSRFLMEQASHFDIASLLSSLNQLREENTEIEDSVERLVSRRDHLLAVRARLLALNSLAFGAVMNSEPQRAAPTLNGPSSRDGRALVSPSLGPPAVPSPREKASGMLPSPRERDQRLGQPSSVRDQRDPRAGQQPSPRDQRDLRVGQPSPREQQQRERDHREHDRSPRLHPSSVPLENGLDTSYSRVSSAHLLTMATPTQSHAKPQNPPPHRSQHSPVGPRPPHSSYSSQSASLSSHPQQRPPPHYTQAQGYQMVSPPNHPPTSHHSLPPGSRPPAPRGGPGPPHGSVSSSHPGHLPGGHPGHQMPPGAHPGGHPHGIPQNAHQHHLSRASSQPQLPPKK